jgi:hypothetical protein
LEKNPSLFQANQDSDGPFEIIDGCLLGGGYMAGGYEPPNRYPKRMMKSKSCSTDLMKNLPPNLLLKRTDLMKRLMKRKVLLVILVEQLVSLLHIESCVGGHKTAAIPLQASKTCKIILQMMLFIAWHHFNC